MSVNRLIPSPFLVRWVQRFLLSWGITLLLSVLLLSGCSNLYAAESLQWTNTNNINQSVLQSAIAENTSLPADKSHNISVATVPTKDSHKQLLIFNYNNADTCGELGCLYAGYLVDKNQESTTAQQVFSFYLQPQLPQGHQLISFIDDATSQLPCLKVKQTNLRVKTLQDLTYCFNGSNYQLNTSNQVKF